MIAIAVFALGVAVIALLVALVALMACQRNEAHAKSIERYLTSAAASHPLPPEVWYATRNDKR